MNASKMMARMTTTTQKKNTMMPGIAYPATVLALATHASYPQSGDLVGDESAKIPDAFCLPALVNRRTSLCFSLAALEDVLGLEERARPLIELGERRRL
jgi:hypothetical protein